MNDLNIELVKVIQDKHMEVKYNEKFIVINNKRIHIEMQGKINCPVLNTKISSLTCSKFMEQKGWPRHIDNHICDRANCKIYKSIQKNMANRNENKTRKNNKETR